jgi:hypothetical protein
MSEVRSQPCSACPYRQDVPSGLWAHHEYEKLRPYDNPTPDQPFAPFMCHATPDHYCSGWAITHNSRGHEFELLALRMRGNPDIPGSEITCFGSGNEAADHGQADIEEPSPQAVAVVERLTRKYPRLRDA